MRISTTGLDAPSTVDRSTTTRLAPSMEGMSYITSIMRDLDDGPEAARAGIARYGLVGDRLDRALVEYELDVVEPHRLLVLAQHGVLRLGDDALEVLARKVLEGDLDRQAADELGDHAELHEVVGMELGEEGPDILGCRGPLRRRRSPEGAWRRGPR